MDIRNERALDRQYVESMEQKAKSRNPKEAKIARQGLALRKLSMRAQEELYSTLQKRSSDQVDGSIESSSTTSFVTLLDGATPTSLYSPEELALVRRDTASTEPEPDEEIKELLDSIRNRKPVLASTSEEGDYVERLLAGVGEDVRCLPAQSRPSSFQRGSFIPSRIPPPHKREENPIDLQLRTWGKSYWFLPEQQKGLEARTYDEAPIAIQRKLIKEALEPNLIMHFPHWKPFRTVGRGRYCVSKDLPYDKLAQNLLARMGDFPDIVGGFGQGVSIEGHPDLDFHSLLCVKYEKEMNERILPPQTEVIDGVQVVRGFPSEFNNGMRIAETFLYPTTYEVFDYLDPFGRISDHRLVQNHYWTPQKAKEDDPRQYTLENTYPAPPHDWANIPKHVKFTNPAKPSHVTRPGRRSVLQGSDLEALKARDEPPMPDETTMRARALMVGAKAVTNAKPRPSMSRKLSNKGKKFNNASALLGNKRTSSKGKDVEQKDELEEIVDETLEEAKPCFGRSPVIPRPSPRHSGIAQLIDQPGLGEKHTKLIPDQTYIPRSKSKVNLSANRNKNEVNRGAAVNLERQEAALAERSLQLLKDSSSKPIDRKENVESASTSSILNYYMGSLPERGDSTKVPSPEENSPPLRSILTNPANPQDICQRQSEKKTVDWASEFPRSSSIPINIPAHPISVSWEKQPHFMKHVNSQSPNPPHSMAIAIKEIEAIRQSGIALSTNPSRRGSSAVVEMARSQTRDRESRLAAKGAVNTLADYGTALAVLKEVHEENEAMEKQEETARNAREACFKAVQDHEEEILG